MQARHAMGVAALAGIGFTVSLFIAELAYTDQALVETAEIGIFAGSLVAGLVGAVVLGLRGERRVGGDGRRRTTSDVSSEELPCHEG